MTVGSIDSLDIRITLAPDDSELVLSSGSTAASLGMKLSKPTVIVHAALFHEL